MHRGINKMRIFDEDADFEAFLRFVEAATRKQGIEVHAFALMPNHHHLQVTPHDPMAVPLAMKQLHADYTEYFNSKHRRTGTIWGTRYRSVLIEDELQWIKCLRYVEQNPVRAGMVATPADYRWSSYCFNALGKVSAWLSPHSVYLALGATAQQRQAIYRELCATPLTGPEMAVHRRRRKSGRVAAGASSEAEIVEAITELTA